MAIKNTAIQERTRMINIAKPSTDAYTWCATYHDGALIPEYDDDRPDGRGFAEVDSSQVKMLSLSAAHHVVIPEDAEPVFFRRRWIMVDPNIDEYETGSVVHCIGWKKSDDACYLFVFDNGSTILTTDLNAV